MEEETLKEILEQMKILNSKMDDNHRELREIKVRMAEVNK